MERVSKCSVCETSFTTNRKNQIHCSTRCGNAYRSRIWRVSGKEDELRKTPKGRYHIHKTNANRVGVPFLLTFDEWWKIWEPYWAEDNYGKLCMCRTGDIGAYEVGNVRIDTWQNNYREARNLPLV